jgi:hypothetical protein
VLDNSCTFPVDQAKIVADHAATQNYEVVWKPIPGTSQELALSCPADQILYHGARGPGKTDTQLMRYARNVGKGYGKFWSGVIFDREYKSLGDLIKKSQHWFRQIWTEDEAWFLASNSQLKWVWATGEELIFRTIDDPQDYWKYHGQEFAFMGWNELTQWPTSDCYDIMQSCNRTSWTQEKDSPRDENGDYTLAPIPLENFATTNSYGIGHYWVKNKFIIPAENGQIVTTLTTVIDPATKQDVEIELTQCAIFGSWVENIYLPAKYIAMLKNESDPNRRKSWYTGSWDITAGGALDDVWNKSIHVVPRFRVPATWRLIDRSYDDGSVHPFSIGWWVEATGETIQLPYPTLPGAVYGANGFYDWTPAAGSLIQLSEWYGFDGKFGSNKGIKLGSRAIAKGIVEREFLLVTQGWIPKLPDAGPADKRIYSHGNNRDNEVPAKTMEREGVFWEMAAMEPGSRERGLTAMRDRLQASIDGDTPGIYFMDNCVASVATIPILPRDPRNINDVDTKAEDHPYDMARYRVHKGNLRVAYDVVMRFPR